MITLEKPKHPKICLPVPDQEIEYYRRASLIPATLVNAATSTETWKEIFAFHNDLASDDYVRYVDRYYRDCIRKYGSAWHYLDIVNVLYAAAKLIQPKHYLEIGVRRGRTVCTVAHGCPSVNIFGFDLWVRNYAGMDNPGEAWVISELRKHGHRGVTQMISGDSRITIPEFLQTHPEMQFNLITVDGDHSESGARIDLENVIPRLAPGGVLIFDDISHPDLPHMKKLWREIVRAYPNLDTHEFTDAGYGVAFAINRGITCA